MKLLLKTGRRPLPATVLSVDVPEEFSPSGILVDPRHPANPLPFQKVGGVLFFQAPPLGPRRSLELDFQTDKTYPSRYKDVSVTEKPGSLSINIAGKLFTRYIYSFPPPQTRPCFHPLIGPRDIPVTRAWPLEEKKGEERDHPHHRSLFFAHGDVNGVDFWSEKPGAGRQTHEGFLEIFSGRFAGGFTERLRWEAPSGELVLSETRSLRFYNPRGNLRIFDAAISLKAETGDVLFGDTKEGGIIAFRVAESMKGARGGRIENAFGAIGEKECWGKPSPWVDYSGLVKGKRIGLAVFDHPDNLRHPTRWHVRDYGLFAVNPFGLSEFRFGKERDGTFHLPKGASLDFRFRVIIHLGDAARARISAHFLSWLFPPEIHLED